MNRIYWIDYGKGSCMLIVVVYHIMCIYLEDSSYSFIFLPFFLTTFFFISGYLTHVEKPNIKKEFNSIIRKLLIPYLIFTSLIWIPKALFYGNEVSIQNYLIDIFGGYASWFVAALIVAKIIFLFLRYIFKSIITIGFISVAIFILGVIVSASIYGNLPWYFNLALISILYISMGYICKCKKPSMASFKINYKLLFCISFTVYAIVLYLYDKHEFVYIFALNKNNFNITGIFYFILSSIVGIIMLLTFCKLLPSKLECLNFVGKNSLIFYFINGAIISTSTIFVNKFIIDKTVGSILIFVVTVFLISVSSYIIDRYFPWVIGKKRLN